MSELNIEVNGTGPDLVLLHGWGLNLRVWDGLVDELRDRFRLIAVDLPGHGKSPWNLVQGTPAEQAWMIHAALASVSNRYSLLGWSLGAQIALDLTAAMPAPIERLVLVAATPRFSESDDWPHGMKAAVLAQMATRLRQDYRRTVSDFLELQVRGSVDGNNVLDQLRRALVTHGEARPEALEAGLRTLAGGDLRATLAHVRAPTLVVAGQYDRITLPEASSALASALPDGRYVEIGRAAHAPFLSHRGEFAALVSDFLLSGKRNSVRKRQAPTATATANSTGRKSGTLRKLKVARKGKQVRPQTAAGKVTRTKRAQRRAAGQARTSVRARDATQTRINTRARDAAQTRATPRARGAMQMRTTSGARGATQTQTTSRTWGATRPRTTSRARGATQARTTSRTQGATQPRATSRAQSATQTRAISRARGATQTRATVRARSTAPKRADQGAQGTPRTRPTTRARSATATRPATQAQTARSRAQAQASSSTRPPSKRKSSSR